MAGRLGEVAQEAKRAEHPIDLLIIEYDPAQRLQPVIVAARQEATRPLGQICQDHARLAELLVGMDQNRHFAHLVDGLPVLGRALHALAEKIDKDGFPIRADEVEHQRGAISVSGLSEAIELVLGHGAPLTSTGQHHAATGFVFALKMSAGERQPRQLGALEIAYDQEAALVCPLAALDEIRRASVLRSDSAL